LLGCGHLLRGERLIGDVYDGFEDRLELRILRGGGGCGRLLHQGFGQSLLLGLLLNLLRVFHGLFFHGRVLLRRFLQSLVIPFFDGVDGFAGVERGLESLKPLQADFAEGIRLDQAERLKLY